MAHEPVQHIARVLPHRFHEHERRVVSHPRVPERREPAYRHAGADDDRRQPDRFERRCAEPLGNETAEEQTEHDRLKAQRREERRKRKEERRAAQRRGRSGVRTKFLIESLRSEMVLLQQLNAKLRRIVAVRLPGQSEEIFRYACRPDPVVVQGSAESLADSFPGLDVDSLGEEEDEDSSDDNDDGADKCGNAKEDSTEEQGSGTVDRDFTGDATSGGDD